jgi:hypothetical protein
MPAKDTTTKTPKKAPARKRAAKTKAPPLDQDVQAPALTFDFPQEGEPISSREYTLRLTSGEGVPSVEVSVDGGPWMPSRPAVGHWWFDWSGFAPGDHELRGRAVGADGRELVVQRRCRVEETPDLNV